MRGYQNVEQPLPEEEERVRDIIKDYKVQASKNEIDVSVIDEMKYIVYKRKHL